MKNYLALKDPTLIEFAKLFKDNPMFQGEMRDNYPEVFSIYQRHYANNKGHYTQFLKDFGLQSIFKDYLWEQNIKPKIKTKEEYFKEIKEEADSISKNNNGKIPRLLTSSKETRRLGYLIQEYSKLKNVDINGTTGYMNFLKDIGYNVESNELSIKDIQDFLKEKNINKKYYSSDIRPFYLRFKRFEKELDMTTHKIMSLAGYTLIEKFNRSYYKDEIIKYYNEVGLEKVSIVGSKEYGKMYYYCKRYNPDKSWKTTLKELGLNIK